MKTVVKIYCLPSEVKEEKLIEMYELIKETIASVRELKITAERINVLFLPDMMKQGLGDEIIIEIERILDRPEITMKVLDQLVNGVADSLSDFVSEWAWKKPGSIEISAETFGSPSKKTYLEQTIL